MILVTGATGHIGNVLVKKLTSSRMAVRVLILPGDDLRPLAGLDVEIVEGDITDFNSISPLFEDVDRVFHLAGIISIMSGQDELLYRVNVMGTRNVVEACLKNNVDRLIYTSSVHALKEPPHGTQIDETCFYEPEYSRGGYDRTKAQASLEVLEGVKKGLDSVIVCPSGIIGPCDYNVSQMGQLILKYMNGNMKAYIDGAYDFVDVRDVAEGLILACRRGKAGGTYILSGEKITVQELMFTLEEITGVKRPWLKVPHWMANAAGKITSLYYRNSKSKPLFTSYSTEVLVSNCNINNFKARKELGYDPRPIKESLKDSVEWFKNNSHVF
ncbi:SDR family oxidoreductase [Methanobacterium sp.]|uniref:SDR family oxidoreductase n=1 Tax=Methanobacterium sp. TaxID=2164 RepID=UPI0025D5A972|nr:SDR family oxidoreductase [Methanobacterium sp.]MBI5460274.1 SDR family oxidoreductase [Methanobacterium sp.]